MTRFILWFRMRSLEWRMAGITFKDMQKDLARLLAINNELRAELRLARAGAELENEINRLKNYITELENGRVDEGYL